jgi:hypothetical protein
MFGSTCYTNAEATESSAKSHTPLDEMGLGKRALGCFKTICRGESAAATPFVAAFFARKRHSWPEDTKLKNKGPKEADKRNTHNVLPIGSAHLVRVHLAHPLGKAADMER